MNLQETYDDYQYQLLKMTTLLSEGPATGHPFDRESFEFLMRRIDALETLIDLYAYLVALQKDHSAVD